MIPRIFVENIDKRILKLPRSEIKHIKAMRLKNGDYIEVMDGKGTIGKGEIEISSEIQIRILEKKKLPTPPNIWVGIPVLKPKRISFLIEKMGELGVKGIFPLITHFSQRYRYNNFADRWKNILISSIKQSGNPYLPDIEPLKTIQQAIDMGFDTIIFGDKIGEKEFSISGKTLCITGPEGGFSSEEKKLLVDNGAIPANLGTYTLRTETAMIILTAEAMKKAVARDE